MYYAFEDGVLDLYPTKQPITAEPEVFLLEINARPPGHGSSSRTAIAAGVDYGAIQLLYALDEPARLKCVVQPFLGGTRYWHDAVFINVDKPGTYDDEDPGQQLAARLPDLMGHVRFHACYYKRGDQVTDVPARIATFIIVSNIGRKHLLGLS